MHMAHAANTLGCHHFCAQLGHLFVLLFIVEIFIGKTTEQSPTDTADLIGVKGQLLILCHADADRCEFTQPTCATKLAATLADAIQQFCFVTHTNLSHFDASAKDTSKVAHKVAEVYTRL